MCEWMCRLRVLKNIVLRRVKRLKWAKTHFKSIHSHWKEKVRKIGWRQTKSFVVVVFIFVTEKLCAKSECRHWNSAIVKGNQYLANRLLLKLLTRQKLFNNRKIDRTVKGIFRFFCGTPAETWQRKYFPNYFVADLFHKAEMFGGFVSHSPRIKSLKCSRQCQHVIVCHIVISVCALLFACSTKLLCQPENLGILK